MRRSTSADPCAGTRRHARRVVTALAVGLLAVPAALAVAPPASAAETATAQGVRTGAVGGDALASTRIVTSPDETPLPVVGAASWLVADATTGTVLAAKDAHGRFMPASTLKTLTALTVLPRLSKSEVYVGRAQDTQVDGT